MGNITLKEYSDEESRIYEESIAKMRENMKNGMQIDEACDAIDVKDSELKRLIAEDFLKITIAEMRYTQGLPLEAVAQELKIPYERVVKVHRMMIEEAMQTQAAQFRSFHPENLGLDEPKGNA